MQWHIGTSGWSYDAWTGDFYPEDIHPGQRLAYYARYFDAVEINNSFYHLPKRQQMEHWQAVVPDTFTFAVKGSRFITHNKKLKDAASFLPNLMQIVDGLPKMGPMIFQLPPHWHKNLERLAEFLAALPQDRRFAMEFRDPDWHSDDVYALLKKYNVAFCLFEKGALRSPFIVTADFIYVRLHGRKEGYKGRYTDAMLTQWRDWIREQRKDAYVFFDNTDEKIHAIENALTFRRFAAEK